jgi:hypothetical protein
MYISHTNTHAQTFKQARTRIYARKDALKLARGHIMSANRIINFSAEENIWIEER